MIAREIGSGRSSESVYLNDVFIVYYPEIGNVSFLIITELWQNIFVWVSPLPFLSSFFCGVFPFSKFWKEETRLMKYDLRIWESIEENEENPLCFRKTQNCQKKEQDSFPLFYYSHSSGKKTEVNSSLKITKSYSSFFPAPELPKALKSS